MITGQFPPVMGGGGAIVYNLSKALMALKLKETENVVIEKIVIVTTKDIDKNKYGEVQNFSIKIDRSILNQYGILVKRINASFSTKLFQIEQAIQEILNIVKKENINVIHAHHYMSIYIGSVIKESYGIPLVASSYKVPIFYSSQYERLIKSDPNYAIFNHLAKMNIDVWIGYSKAFTDELKNKFQISPQKIKLVFPGIETSKFDSKNCINNKTIISPGRLDPRKHYERIIEAVGTYNQNHTSKKNITLTGIPTSKKESEYKKKLISEAKNQKVKLDFSPYKFNEVAKIYNSRYACILPSDREGLSLVMIESLAYGCPLIISEQANQGDHIISDGKNGLIFNPEANGDLARRLEDLGNDELRTKIIDGGKATIKNKFDIDKFAMDNLKVYSDIIT